MLNITGVNRFFFVRDFHDMRCKYDKVLSIVHQQLNREPEDGDVFIVMSKDLRLVRLFRYDRRSYSMFEKRFRPGYQFMQVICGLIACLKNSCLEKDSAGELYRLERGYEEGKLSPQADGFAGIT